MAITVPHLMSKYKDSVMRHDDTELLNSQKLLYHFFHQNIRPVFGCSADPYHSLQLKMCRFVHANASDDARCKMKANQMWFNSFILFFFWHWFRLLHSWINNFRCICFVWKQIIALTIKIAWFILPAFVQYVGTRSSTSFFETAN